MKKNILESVEEGVRAIEWLKQPSSLSFMQEAALLLSHCLMTGGKILIAGNGGSLCDAMHFAEELSGYYRQKRKALAAIALADPGHMSCVANDVGYEYVFSRGIEALGRPEDVLVVLTTSGMSQNLLNAVACGREIGMKTVAFLGKTGGSLKGLCDLELIISSFTYSDRIQEAHMTAIHIIIEQIEAILFNKVPSEGAHAACCHDH